LGGVPVSLARNSAAAESEGGQKFLPPTPFLFARPSGKVFFPAERSSAIKIRNLDFAQKKFGFRPINTN